MNATGGRLMWLAVVCTFTLAAFSLLHLASLEFGPLRHHAIGVDELYFASCGVRGLVAGQIPISGCHDNKAPLIFFVHQLLQLDAPPYSLLAIKIAAFGVVGLLTVLVAAVAFKLAGAMAAVIAAALLISTMTSDATLLALKTEAVGAVFMLAGIGFLLRADRRPWGWLAGGIALGLAVATKQTFAFAAVAVVIWSWFAAPGDSLALRFRSFSWNMARFGAALATPLLAFFLVFLLQDRHEEYLASLILYPSVYGADAPAPWFKELAWRVGDILDALSKAPLLAVLFAAVVVGGGRNTGSDRIDSPPWQDARHLLVAMTAAMLLVTLVSPNFFNFHLIPAWVLMAILGGILVGETAEMAADAAPKVPRFLAAALATFAILMAATSWLSNGARGRTLVFERPAAVLGDGRGQFAYVLGTWPQFYVYNDLVPASDIVFPWALPGAPMNWAYLPPDPASAHGRLLAQTHQANLRQLFEDFRRTPPRYIVVSHAMARSVESPRVADIPGFDDYLRTNCVFAQTLPEYLSSAQSLFRCNAADGSSAPEGNVIQ